MNEPWAGPPVAAYRRAADRVLAAFAEPGARDRHLVLPELDPEHRFPAEVAISFHFIDYVVHAWDVAVSLGDRIEFTPEVLRAAAVVADAVPRGRNRRLTGAAFGPVIEAPGADGLDAVLATLGRRPDWSALPYWFVSRPKADRSDH